MKKYQLGALTVTDGGLQDMKEGDESDAKSYDTGRPMAGA